MNQLISRQFARKELESQLGIKGKEFTEWLRSMKLAGRINSMMVHCEPASSTKREARYVFVAQTGSLFSE